MAGLEEVIKYIDNVPKTRYNKHLEDMSLYEQLRLKLADKIMGNKLSEIKDWYLDLYNIAHDENVNVDKIKNQFSRCPSFYLGGLGQVRLDTADWLLEGTVKLFSQWYNELENRVEMWSGVESHMQENTGCCSGNACSCCSDC